MEISKVGSNLSDFMKGNGTKIMIALGGGVVLYALMKNMSGGTTLVAPTAYSGYPDSVTNANTIIDSVNQNTKYENDLTRDLIEKNFDSTNGYIKDGVDNLKGNIDNVSDTVNSIRDDVSNVKDTVNNINDNLNKTPADKVGNLLNKIVESNRVPKVDNNYFEGIGASANSLDGYAVGA